jgi:hypothetical protein
LSMSLKQVKSIQISIYNSQSQTKNFKKQNGIK